MDFHEFSKSRAAVDWWGLIPEGEEDAPGGEDESLAGPANRKGLPGEEAPVFQRPFLHGFKYDYTYYIYIHNMYMHVSFFFG